MASFIFQGLDEYVSKLYALDEYTDKYIGEAVYQGANPVANAVRANIDALPAVPDGVGLNAYWHKDKHTDVPLTESAKKGLQAGFGIAKLQTENGYHHVKLGFEGYNNLRTKSFPNGQPNLLIARRLERGSSVSKAHPIIKPAVKATKDICEQNMKRSIDESIKTLMK